MGRAIKKVALARSGWPAPRWQPTSEEAKREGVQEHRHPGIAHADEGLIHQGGEHERQHRPEKGAQVADALPCRLTFEPECGRDKAGPGDASEHERPIEEARTQYRLTEHGPARLYIVSARGSGD